MAVKITNPRGASSSSQSKHSVLTLNIPANLAAWKFGRPQERGSCWVFFFFFFAYWKLLRLTSEKGMDVYFELLCSLIMRNSTPCYCSGGNQTSLLVKGLLLLLLSTAIVKAQRFRASTIVFSVSTAVSSKMAAVFIRLNCTASCPHASGRFSETMILHHHWHFATSYVSQGILQIGILRRSKCFHSSFRRNFLCCPALP